MHRTALVLALIPTATTFAQADWTPVSGTPQPSGRTNHMFCADSIGLWLFGGVNSLAQNDTWRFLLGSWQQLTPANSPPPRFGGQMVFDSRRGTLVLFGGKRAGAYLDDTWEFANNNWKQVPSPASPPARYRFRMAYDAKRQVTLLFGGEDANKRYGDTWIYDGNRWNQLSPPNSPAPRARFAMCYNSRTGETILFGGSIPTGTETWKWTGATWTKLTPAASPPATRIIEMAYDPVRDRVVLFGGQTNGAAYVDTTWEFDGATWVQRNPSTKPPRRRGQATAWVAAEGRIYMHGGYDGGFVGDLWSYSTPNPASFGSLGTGCLGANGRPTLAATAPWLGDTFTVTATNLPATTPTSLIFGLSDQTWGSFSLPLDLGFMSAPGCRLYTDLLLQIPMTNPGGTATFTTKLPTTAALAGIRFFNQTWAIDPTANAPGLIVSNAGVAVTGIR